MEVASEDWGLSNAPLYRLPADKRARLARHVGGARQYTRVDGVVVIMPEDHFIVWSAWERKPGGGVSPGERPPAYIPRETWDRTYSQEQDAGGGLIFADKTNAIRAAVYTGQGPIRMLVNENDPADPRSWASLDPGDHVVLAVDPAGQAMTYVAVDGVTRNDQYPIHGDNWEHLGYEPVDPLSPGFHPTISQPEGPVEVKRLNSNVLRGSDRKR